MRRAFLVCAMLVLHMPHNVILRARACVRWLLTACEACNLSHASMHVCLYRAGYNVIRLCVHGPMSTQLLLPQQPRLQCGALRHAITRLIGWQGDQGVHGSQCSSCFTRSCCRYLGARCAAFLLSSCKQSLYGFRICRLSFLWQLHSEFQGVACTFLPWVDLLTAVPNTCASHGCMLFCFMCSMS